MFTEARDAVGILVIPIKKRNASARGHVVAKTRTGRESASGQVPEDKLYAAPSRAPFQISIALSSA
jgi:hypothetical protein